jgi:hypothetical protein
MIQKKSLTKWKVVEESKSCKCYKHEVHSQGNDYMGK